MSAAPTPETPYLAVDVDVLTANLRSMAAFTAERGLALRPHAKTHKSREIARLQLEFGAVGLTVATVAEAEVFADAGATDLFLAYPVWAAGRRGERLRAVAERVSLQVGVDSVAAAGLLGTALAGTGCEVLVEIDSGHHRSGVRPELAGELARAVAAAGLTVRGAFTFPGHGYLPDGRAGAAADEATALALAGDALRSVGIDSPVLSGGSTPTAQLTDGAVLTELRPGVYAVNDAQQVELGSCTWADVALTAAATVVSRSGSRVVLDAGGKTLGADRAPWSTGAGRLPDHPEARIVSLSEHHAVVAFPDGAGLPALGDVVRVAPNHVCAAVNLADELVVVAGGAVVDRWAVAARGANT